MKRVALLALAICLVGAPGKPGLLVWASAADGAPSSLFEQSASAMLHRDFADRDISYLLLDAGSGRVLAQQWDHPERPIPVGSLVKPFTAAAYGAAHHYRFPDHECAGGATCWLPRGHGHLDLKHALAYSCNSYFRALASDVRAGQAAAVFHTYGLDTPASGAMPEQLVGLDETWTIAPLQLARAYLDLASRRADPGIRQILSGMSESARAGTGAGVDRRLAGQALAKTGTAACTHGGAPGDGFVVALVPAEAPTLLLMVRVHSVPGSRAAVTAGQMLERLSQRTAGVPPAVPRAPRPRSSAAGE